MPRAHEHFRVVPISKVGQRHSTTSSACVNPSSPRAAQDLYGRCSTGRPRVSFRC
jgi:hypothetical protein